MESASTVSVIIPTYNRRDSLLRALRSIEEQTLPMAQLEVIVVDDGSTDDTKTVVDQKFPFALRYLQQKNQGATAARNYGARTCQSDILVFIDDDVTIAPQTLEAFIEKFNRESKILVMGTINKRSDVKPTVYTQVVLTMSDHSLTTNAKGEFHFTDCNSELLACRRGDFFEIGMFQDPTAGHGWPNWDDVDLGYRAHLKGFRLVGAKHAVAEHWDYSISDRVMACKRFFRAARSAVWLFHRHPGLQPLIPMLHDKTPVVWGKDPLGLILRKLARGIVSSPPLLGSLAKLADILERYYPSPVILRRLYYLLHGANLFQGYRKGLSEFMMAGAKNEAFSG